MITRKRKLFVKLCWVGTAILVAIIIIGAILPQSVKRDLKSIKNDFTGGMERTVTVYDYSGNPIPGKSWTGKFDVKSSDNKILFDTVNGRVIIHGGIVIDEEVLSK